MCLDKLEVTGNEDVKTLFVRIFVKRGSIYVNPRLQWSKTHSTQYLHIHFTNLNASFCDILWYLSVCSACHYTPFTLYCNAV